MLISGLSMNKVHASSLYEPIPISVVLEKAAPQKLQNKKAHKYTVYNSLSVRQL